MRDKMQGVKSKYNEDSTLKVRRGVFWLQQRGSLLADISYER